MAKDLASMSRVAVRETGGTLKSSEKLLECLDACSVPPKSGLGLSSEFKISPRHAVELRRYLGAHREKLQQLCAKMENTLAAGGPLSEGLVQLLVSRRFEFESAVRFVEEAFLKPRKPGGEPLVLEVADWLCVDGFQVFVSKNAKDKDNYPLGPLVALDSRRTPAVWDDNTELSTPAPFDLTARIHRTPESSIDGLAVFPVITLPGDLSHLPEYYALLSHEVGHAADAAFEFTKQIVERLQKGCRREDGSESPLLKYWRAWMREIVADAAGVTLSGEAFALAWWRFVRPMSPTTDLTYSNPYPPISLRLAFLRLMLADRGELSPAIPADLPEETLLTHELFAELKNAFASAVMPLLRELIFSAVPFHPQETFVRVSANHALEQQKISWFDREFRILPSILTLAITRKDGLETWKLLPQWLQDFREENKLPGWQTQTSSDWKFSKDFLPTLRPTIVGPDGVTKTPPWVLLLTHRKIALLGATQKWLLARLEETAPLREEPWESIDIYFASNTLLKSVEYYDKDDKRRTTASVREERDAVMASLKEFFARNPECCHQVRFYFFSGPPVFGSFWDWDKQGGRIHISPQLVGMDISKCPAIDHVWLQDMPTHTYDQYCNYISAINKRAKVA